MTIRFRSKLWHYPGPGGWHFVTLPLKVAKGIKDSARGERRGWGSVRVRATIGGTSWNTSIFPDRKSNSYLLPVKATVRSAEDVGDGDSATISLDVIF